MSKRELEYTGTLSKDQVVEYLEGLAAAIKAGQVCLEKAQDFLTVQPSEDIILGLKARIKDRKESISLELKWEKPIKREN